MEKMWLIILCAGLAAAVSMRSAGAAMPAPKPDTGTPLLNRAASARCWKWDCVLHPVRVTATSTPEPGRWIRYCVDGYPTNVSQPLPREHWRTAAPTKDKPEVLTIDYGRPVAATRFVHYYEGVRPPAAWKDVEILSSTDNQNWQQLVTFSNLQADYPQVLPMDKPTPAQYYRFVIKSIADGATHIATHEIETYYGSTVGSIKPGKPVQSEPFDLQVRVLSPDSALSGATLRLVSPKDSFRGKTEVPVSSIAKGGSSVASFKLIPVMAGPQPVIVELRSRRSVIDSRHYTIIVEPKLQIKDLSPAGATSASVGQQVRVKGNVFNAGTTGVPNVRVAWMGKIRMLSNLDPGKSASFEISAAAKPGYSGGALVASGGELTKTVLRRPVISASAVAASVGASRFSTKDGAVAFSLKPAGDAATVTGAFEVRVGDNIYPLAMVGHSRMAAVVPGAVFVVDVVERDDAQAVEMKCAVVPDDPNPVDPPWLDMELRIGVNDPRIMFRPHIDWYTVEHGPNVPDPANGHHSATRMLCVQTGDATLSLVPDTDTMRWGFTKSNEMTMQVQIPLAPSDPLGRQIWRSIDRAPTRFNLLLPVYKGDWWDAYRHVVYDILKFQQPRQWAMPVTQMQMHNSRYIMRYEAWSEKWQTVRSFPSADVFFNFYGTTYTLPALYSWYLATDLAEAKVKAEKVLDWLLSLQEKDGFAAGGWFSQYADEGGKLVGRDQAGNRWIMPHSTGTAAKTLLWYWNASGRTNDRVFQAAKSACDWLITTQTKDGAWPYAFDLEGKPLTDLTDAGQIWCTWALWQMGQHTGEDKYKQAAVRSKDAFKKTFVDVHRYMGYWEDVSGGAGKVTRSWEAYEPAIACLVFTEMGDRQLALECAKDTATWSWTRIISTRQYETCYGQTTEQSLCGPAQAQSPMVAVGLHQIYQDTGDKIWSDFAGAMKAINFCADPDQIYGMCATTGWFDATRAVAGPPYDNVRQWVSAANARGDEYGRGVWIEWQTSQFAWLALEWLVREANLRAPQYVSIDPNTFRGTLLGEPGRIKMPEERCDVNGIDHYDINWVGYANDDRYALLVMNHKQKTTVAIRPHEGHLEVYTRAPRVFVGTGQSYNEVKPIRRGVQYMVDIPAGANALLVWDRIK